MSKSFLKMVALALITLGFVACGEKKSPIEVETFTETKPALAGDYVKIYYVGVRAVVDSVVIQKISINRGNCGERAVDKTIKFGETTRIKIGNYTVGYYNVGSGCSPRDIKEVQVVTDKGTWTFNW